jgi:hypothetical protein
MAAAVGASVLLVGGMALAGASPASADQVWQQSQGRVSADAACPSSDAADLETGWSQWNKSYEMWMNHGQGGWTCTRSVTWAKDAIIAAVEDVVTPHPSGLCVLYVRAFIGPDYYLNFAGGWSLPPRSTGYTSADCTTGAELSTGLWTVYAPDGFSAETLCREAFPATVSVVGWALDVYECHP